jgi:hypothetical protein
VYAIFHKNAHMLQAVAADRQLCCFIAAWEGCMAKPFKRLRAIAGIESARGAIELIVIIATDHGGINTFLRVCCGLL